MPAGGGTPDRRARVQSVDVALRLVDALARSPQALHLRDLAERAGMPPAKAHRYLSSLIAGGMVVQDAATSCYDLGPLAVRVGFAALERNDLARLVMTDLAALRDDVGETVSLIAWGERGPTVQRTEDGPHDVMLRIRPGTVLPLAGSATGALFRAYLRADIIARAEGELTAPARARREREARDARRRGMTRTVGTVLPGVSAVVVPLLDRDGALVAAVAAYGRTGSFDARWTGAPALALRRFAQRFREREP